MAPEPHSPNDSKTVKTPSRDGPIQIFKNMFFDAARPLNETLFEVKLKDISKTHAQGTCLLDDRLMILQKAIEEMVKGGKDSPRSRRFNGYLVTLFNGRFRDMTGSPLIEKVGAEQRQPYVRMVAVSGSPAASPSSPPQPLTLPDPSQIFDKLLHQAGTPQASTLGNSGLSHALATIIFLSLSYPGRDRHEYNSTTPYLDLSPLYGHHHTSKSIRLQNGRGLLASDCFLEDRQMWLSPTVSTLLILFNRNHNYIARRLLAINEHKKWLDPPPQSSEAQDNEIFNLARSINCILFKNIVIEDFMKGLLGPRNVGPGPNLDFTYDLIKNGAHQQVRNSSIECSLLYYCPGMMSKEDIEWQEKVQRMPDPVQEPDPHSRNCPNDHQTDLARTPGRGFLDADLAAILKRATKTEAGVPGARSIPSCLKKFSVDAIKEARASNTQVCTMNEFRTWLGLKPFERWEDWNDNPNIVHEAKNLYSGGISQLELFPGLQAEATPKGFGFGLGYTQTFGLLVDLVSAIRSDRRYTTDFSEGELTKWGFSICRPNPGNGAFGTMLSNLLLRNLPRDYSYNNIYGLFPLTIPEETKKALNEATEYEYDPEARTIHVLDKLDEISTVLNDPKRYKAPYHADLKSLTNGYGYMLGFDDEILHDADQHMMLYALMPDTRSFQQYRKYFRETSERLIIKKDKELAKMAGGTKSLDIIRDIINPTCTRWVYETICTLDKLQKFDAEIQFRQFSTLYAFIFKKFDPVDGWLVRQEALNAGKILDAVIRKSIEPVVEPRPDTGFIKYVTRLIKEYTMGHELEDLSRTFIERLVATSHTLGRSGRIIRLSEHAKLLESIRKQNQEKYPETPPDKRTGQAKKEFTKRRLVANIMGLSVVMSVNLAQACAHAVDFYLRKEHKKERDAIIRLLEQSEQKVTDAETDAAILGYIHEAQRLGQPFVLQREATKDGEGTGILGSVKKGSLVIADFGAAHLKDEKGSSAPDINPNRQTPSLLGLGLHKCPGLSLVDITLLELFKTIFRTKGLELKSDGGGLKELELHTEPHKTDPRVFLDPESGEAIPYPGSLVAQYTSPPKPKKIPGAEPQLARRMIDLFGSLVVIVSILWGTCVLLLKTSPASISTVQMGSFPCNEPTVIFQQWAVNTIIPGPDGQPEPIEYTLEHKNAHRLSLVDIDARDMQLEVSVDGMPSGLTTDFYLDKSIDCGEDVTTCLKQNFSGGVVVVPPGRHTVKIAWAGKEFIPGTQEIDWGGDTGGRRLKTQLEYCF